MTPRDEALARVRDAQRKEEAVDAAVHDLRMMRNHLKAAGFTTRRSPLLRKIRRALRSAEGAQRNQSARRSWAIYLAERFGPVVG